MCDMKTCCHSSICVTCKGRTHTHTLASMCDMTHSQRRKTLIYVWHKDVLSFIYMCDTHICVTLIYAWHSYMCDTKTCCHSSICVTCKVLTHTHTLASMCDGPFTHVYVWYDSFTAKKNTHMCDIKSRSRAFICVSCKVTWKVTCQVTCKVLAYFYVWKGTHSYVWQQDTESCIHMCDMQSEVQSWSQEPPPPGGVFCGWFPDQEPCVRDFTTRCDRRISSWNLLHTALDQGI